MEYGRHGDGEHDPNFRGPLGGSPQKVTLFALIKHHLRDWFWVGVMIILELVVYFLIPPFHRFVNEPMMEDLRYPKKPETIPTWSVGVVAVMLPVLVFLAYFFKKRSIRDLHNAFLGLATAIIITAVFTDSIKNLVGMPRPDFFHRCFPDGVESYTADEERQVICHPVGGRGLFVTLTRAFPVDMYHVGAFAGLGYMSLYLAGKLGLFDRRGYSSRVFFILFPILGATLIGITRVNDYQHRWVDIIAAGLLGLFVAYVCYRQFYPSIYAREWAGYPYEYAPQGVFSHGLHGPRAVPMLNARPNGSVTPLGNGGNAYDPRYVPNDVETGRG